MHCQTLQPCAQNCANPKCLKSLGRCASSASVPSPRPDSRGRADQVLLRDMQVLGRQARQEYLPLRALWHLPDRSLAPSRCCLLPHRHRPSGKGLNDYYFHCFTCGACMSITMKDHKCIENNLKGNWSRSFTVLSFVLAHPRPSPARSAISRSSTRPTVACFCNVVTSVTPSASRPTIPRISDAPYGAASRRGCLSAHARRQLCSKSMWDMSEYFRALEQMQARQPTPAEFAETKSHILCNDCAAKSTVPFHFIGSPATSVPRPSLADLALLQATSAPLAAASTLPFAPPRTSPPQRSSTASTRAPPPPTATPLSQPPRRYPTPHSLKTKT